MMKDFGVKPYLFPMPTYMIGTYNEDNTVDVMMMAWGGICAEDMVALNLEAEHKTVANLETRRAFTLAVPGADTLRESDFFGIASANKVADKFARTGLHAVRSERVDAPVITEYPLTLECEVVEMQSQPYGLRVLGRIVNVLADELMKIVPPSGYFTAEVAFEAVKGVHKRVKGAYAVVALIAGKGLLAFRDPNGIRPLCFGTQKQADGTTDYLVSSESVTMVGLEYDFVRDLAPGEAIFISKDREFFSCQCAENPQLNPCAFEYVYFARPDSYIDGISVYGARLRLGEYLANEVAEHLNLRDIDVVMPIPDSSRPCAQQLAEKLKLTYREGFIKNRYVGRTFIMPGQEMRKKSVRQKLNAMPVEFADKNILLVDDSIVRGTTMREIVRMARESGAKKVYVASSAPRVMYPNVYGIDMPTRSELICGHGATAEEVARQIGADAVIFQTVEGLKGALKDLNPNITRFDCSCFDGEYVTGDIDATYLDNLEASRSKPVKPAKDDEE